MSHHLTGSYLIAGQPGTSVAGLVLISHHLIAVEALAGQLSDGAAGVACKRMSCHHPCLQCSAEYLLYQAQVDLLCLGLSGNSANLLTDRPIYTRISLLGFSGTRSCYHKECKNIYIGKQFKPRTQDTSDDSCDNLHGVKV